MKKINCLFFDVGNTLGEVDGQLNLHLYADTVGLLSSLQTPSRRFGVISNVPATMTAKNLLQMLTNAGISKFFDESLIVVSTEAKSSKPQAGIYEFAAHRAGVDVGACLFVGENIAEVIGARLAGMEAQLKPQPTGAQP